LLADVQLSGRDPLGQLLLDLHVRGRLAPGSQVEALAESASARAHGRDAAVGAEAGRGMV
jgi:hypothetical protein